MKLLVDVVRGGKDTGWLSEGLFTYDRMSTANSWVISRGQRCRMCVPRSISSVALAGARCNKASNESAIIVFHFLILCNTGTCSAAFCSSTPLLLLLLSSFSPPSFKHAHHVSHCDGLGDGPSVSCRYQAATLTKASPRRELLLKGLTFRNQGVAVLFSWYKYEHKIEYVTRLLTSSILRQSKHAL